MDPGKLDVYPRFKELVTKELGSDVCFVTTALWESFLNAWSQVPAQPDQIEIKFLRQNVQINMGCTITYAPRKARRTPGSSPSFTLQANKNRFFPLLLEEWETLTASQKKFWLSRLQEAGIVPKPKRKRTHPSISTRARKKPQRKNFWNRMEYSMTIVTGRIRALLGK